MMDTQFSYLKSSTQANSHLEISRITNGFNGDPIYWTGLWKACQFHSGRDFQSLKFIWHLLCFHGRSPSTFKIGPNGSRTIGLMSSFPKYIATPRQPTFRLYNKIRLWFLRKSRTDFLQACWLVWEATQQLTRRYSQIVCKWTDS